MGRALENAPRTFFGHFWGISGISPLKGSRELRPYIVLEPEQPSVKVADPRHIDTLADAGCRSSVDARLRDVIAPEILRQDLDRAVHAAVEPIR